MSRESSRIPGTETKGTDCGRRKSHSTQGNRCFYLAVSPKFFAPLANSWPSRSPRGRMAMGQVIVEKPFRRIWIPKELNASLKKFWMNNRSIDRALLCKETGQNLMFFGFAMAIASLCGTATSSTAVQINSGLNGFWSRTARRGFLRPRRFARLVPNHLFQTAFAYRRTAHFIRCRMRAATNTGNPPRRSSSQSRAVAGTAFRGRTGTGVRRERLPGLSRRDPRFLPHPTPKHMSP